MRHPLPKVNTVISTDVVDSGHGSHTRHRALGAAAEEAVLDAMHVWRDDGDWVHRHDGDGDTLLASADIPKAWLLWDFLNELRVGLEVYNRDKNTDNRLRLRVGIDYGDVVVEQDGRGDRPTGGVALVAAPRLRDCRELRTAVDRRPEVLLAVAISDRLYQEVVPSGDRGLKPELFQRIEVDVADKRRFMSHGWLYLPGGEPDRTGTVAEPVVAARTGDPVGSVTEPTPRIRLAADSVEGIQAGVIHGGVSFRRDASPRSTSARGTVGILGALRAAQLDGRLDEDMYAAARLELVRADTEEGSREVMALRRLRGLVADFDDLSTLVNRRIAEVTEDV